MNYRTRKTFIKNIVTFVEGVLIIALLILPAGILGTLEARYTNTGTIVETKGEIITVEDTLGNLWDFCGDGFKVGEKVNVTFDSKHTDNTIKDDEIIKVKKIKKKY